MTTHPIEPEFVPDHDTFDDVIEVRNPAAPDEIVRIGPTITQLMGFGPSTVVAAWVARALGPAARVLQVGAVDEAVRVHDEVLARTDDDLDAELAVLEDRACHLEDAIARFDDAARAGTSDSGLPIGVREANVAQSLAADFDELHGDGSSGDSAFDDVMQAHMAVEAARAVYEDAPRTRRRAAAAELDAAVALEQAALRNAGVATYSQFLATNVGGPVHHANVTGDPAQRDIELRARAAQLLGRLPGVDPAAELREFAAARVEAVLHRPDPATRALYVDELVAIDRRGRALVDALDCAVDEIGTFGPMTWTSIAVGTGTRPLVVDGDLLDAVASDLRDALLTTLRDASFRRRIVVVSDDVMLDSWLASVPNSLLWTSGHLHLVLGEGRPAWDQDDSRRSASLRVDAGRDEHLATCSEHPGTITRLSCSVCRQPFCSVCLVPVAKSTVGTGNSVICVACALERSGARVRTRRSKRLL